MGQIQAYLTCGGRRFFQVLNPKRFYKIYKVDRQGNRKPFSPLFHGDQWPMEVPYDEDVDLGNAHLEIRRIHYMHGKHGEDSLMIP
ncbi:MAG: hypothetical protein WCJ45_09215 [bacterium]